ncbi:MAG TPA: YfhO family protein, partial [Thermodesulfovibrionales bacterium]|nr:YfhO family protein [Thermodesulfovibrionales bacterium]
NELWIEKGGWNDTWMDVSRYVGKVVTLVIEGDGSGMGSFALGDFGLSPGYERERITYDDMLSLHKKELDFLKYIGEYEGLHIYENTNVMDRAFIVHRIEVVKGLEDAIEKLREGVNFREIGLISPPAPPFDKEKFLQGAGKGKGEKQFFDDKVVIKKYAADEIAIDVESKGGLLVLSDLYYPGWKVTVNGQGEQIIKVFGLLRGVAVGEGKSEVLFYYRPVSFYVGCVISFISFVVWGAILTISMSKANPR